MDTQSYSVKILKDLVLDITLGSGVFEPTGTSTEIATAVNNYIVVPGKTLDFCQRSSYWSRLCSIFVFGFLVTCGSNHWQFRIPIRRKEHRAMY